MPSQKQEFSFPGKTTDQLLEIAYGTFSELGWTPKYAGPNVIVGYTPRSSFKHDDEIIVEAEEEIMWVTSSLVHNESFDLMGRNKKHIRDFITTFEKVRATVPRPEWAEAIEELRQQTVQTATDGTKEVEEINKVMNLSGSNLYVTYGIIAINVIVFVLMAINGAGIFEPHALVHINWGSNYSPLTLSGDWWRLFTCIFIHFGIIHLVMNLYALYMAGVYLEPMLGKAKYIIAYLATGIFASLASLWWHSEGVNSAGASGAIFGMYGVFLALLFTNLIPGQIRRSLLQSIGVFVVFNLIYGTKGGIDNAAHLGGLLSGMVIGFIFYTLLKKEERGIKNNLALVAIMAAAVLSAWMYLTSPGNQIPPERRKAELDFLKEMKYPDGELLYEKYRKFGQSEEKIVKMFNDGINNYKDWLTANEENLRLEFEEATSAIEAMKGLDISPAAKEEVNLLGELLNARKEQVTIIKLLVQEDNPENRLKLAEIRNKQEEILARLNKRK
ncbi:MAG TPA: rhomboid family intramembrane serine protease [Chitinophagaceae bacterium]